MHLVADLNVDWEKYSAAPPDAAKIKPASVWLDAVLARFETGHQRSGIVLPWSKTHSDIQLRPGEVSIWAGTNGHGKSALLNQVMIGAMAQGARVCIASMEMKPEATMHRMTRQALGARNPWTERIKGFHRWTDGKLWIYDQQGRVKTDRMIALARYCREEIGIDHLVIDSLMKLGMGTDDYTAQATFVNELCSIAMDTGMHIHLVMHRRKGESERKGMDKSDVKGAGEIVDQVDNLYLVFRNKRKEDEKNKRAPDPELLEEPDALLECGKNRHGEWEGKIALWYEKDSMQFVADDKYRPIEMVKLNDQAANF